ncbi:MAG: hypothetical protein U0792_08440 [Gemmataceae bacterium]
MDALQGCLLKASLRNFPGSPNAGQADRAVRGIPLLRAANIGIFAHEPEEGDARLGITLGFWLLRCFSGWACAWVWHLGKAVMAERARELFRLQHERFEERLLKAAAATGLPRGLRWVKCEITGSAVQFEDLANRGSSRLVPVLIRFEAEEGSKTHGRRSDGPGTTRPATAVFSFHRGDWATAGRVVFNHTPDQTIGAFGQQFRVIDHGHH